MKKIISPSILSADFLHLAEQIDMIQRSKAEWLHCDIMDGHFVPNLTFGLPIIRQISNYTNLTLDVHLMISNSELYVEQYIDAGANVLTVHYEAVIHLHRVLDKIRSKNVMAGVSLNPHTPVILLEDILKDCDLILLMSVNPGFGGQQFIENTIEKIRKLDQLRKKYNPSLLIQVDGGVSSENSKRLFDAGANVLVAGNAIFASDDPITEINKMMANC